MNEKSPAIHLIPVSIASPRLGFQSSRCHDPLKWPWITNPVSNSQQYIV